MSKVVRAVFLDVDGVLLDSLPQHLQICRDLSKKLKPRPHIPTIAEFREMVSRNEKPVSPMRKFFLAVGFPEADAASAVTIYEQEFMRKYRPRPFPGVDGMLRELRRDGRVLGIVTSNTRENVVPALAASMDLFEESCLFFYGSESAPPSKAECLSEGAGRLDTPPSSCIYVGDQPADADAADKAGFRFLGVTYGWGIVAGETRCETVDSVEDIPRKLREMEIDVR